MTNKEASNALKRLITELEILEGEEFNANERGNITKAIKLLEEVDIWCYED